MSVVVAPIPLGRLVMTAGVAALVEQHPALSRAMLGWLAPHRRGECPHMSEHDQQENTLALEQGFRVFTSWPTGLADAPTIWLITEADRSSTCFLLPSEY
jgi:hypothetical protein